MVSLVGAKCFIDLTVTNSFRQGETLTSPANDYPCFKRAIAHGKTLLGRSSNIPRLSLGRESRPLANLKCGQRQNAEAGPDLDNVCQDIVRTVLSSLSNSKRAKAVTAFHSNELDWEVPLRQFDQSIIEYAQQLENVCANIQATRRASTIKFLIGCILIAGDKLPGNLVNGSGHTLTAQLDRTTHRRMKQHAIFACSVVVALSMYWGDCAYNMFHVFAGESTYCSAVWILKGLATTDWFRKARDLPDRSRNYVTNRLIAELKASSARDYLHKYCRYDPEVEVATLLQLE